MATSVVTTTNRRLLETGDFRLLESGTGVSSPLGAVRLLESSTTTITQTAGVGGDQWGASGGGAVSAGPSPIKKTLSYAQRQANYIVSGEPTPATGTRTVESEMSNSALDGHTLDDALPPGGSTAG